MTTHPSPTSLKALSDDVAKVIAGAGLAFVATVNADGTPNLSLKGSLVVVDDHTVVFGDIASPTTVANIRDRPSVEINVVHPLTREGYRFAGRARVTDERSMIAAVTAPLDVDFGITEVVVIDIESARLVRSPRYTMFDATRDDTTRTWTSHFALTSSEAGDRLAEWSELQHAATSIETLPDGVCFRLPAKHADEARDLADRESQCCSFLEIEIIDLGESVEMTITSPNPDGVPVVNLLAGIEGQ